MEEVGGKGGSETETAPMEAVGQEEGLTLSHVCPAARDERCVCVKCGIVEMSGERAHGFVDDVKSCSRAGSTKL